MENVVIEKIGIKQLNPLCELSKQTFIETFAHLNTEENMQTYLNESLSLNKLKSELENKNSSFYFANLNQIPKGYLKINFNDAQTESIHNNNGLEIERIYVLKQFHGLKIGKLLLEKAINIAKENNLELVWLGVWEQNLKAINFYQKFGFKIIDKHIFKLGKDEQTDFIMMLILK